MIIDLSKIYIPTEKQRLFHSLPHKFKLFGGAMGGGKTMAGCAEALMLSLEYPGNRGVIIRKTLKRLRHTTLVTFFKICPKELIASYNKSDLVVRLINGSEILFLEANISLDRELDKLRGLEIGWFFIDEAQEVAEEVFKILTTRLRWRLPDGSAPRYTGLLTCNPSINWIKTRFIDQKLPDHVFIQSLAYENPYLPEDYISTLEDILSEKEKRRLLKGEWVVDETPDMLFKYEWINNSIYKEKPEIPEAEKYLGVDVARFGDDLSVLCYKVGNVVVELKDYEHIDTRRFSNIIQNFIIDNQIPHSNVAIDSVGIGAGVVDNLISNNFQVNEFVGGAKPILEGETTYSFENLRSQGYWYLREKFKNDEIAIPDHRRLISDLMAHRYSISADKKIKVVSKENIKKETGFSPDFSDALMICCANEFLTSAVVSAVVY